MTLTIGQTTRGQNWRFKTGKVIYRTLFYTDELVVFTDGGHAYYLPTDSGAEVYLVEHRAILGPRRIAS